MKYPKLRELDASRQMVDVFKGYNHNLRIGDGEFFEMKNMTSDHYPVLPPRKSRAKYIDESYINGIIAKDNIFIIKGSTVFEVTNKGTVEVCDLRLASNVKRHMVSIGAYVVVMPDKMWFNTIPEMGLYEHGYIEATFNSEKDVNFAICTIDGAEYDRIEKSETAPEDPKNMDYWMDISTSPPTLKRYSSTSSMWVQIATTYIKITCEDIGKDFNVYDSVKISGIVIEALKDLNATMIIQAKGDDYIVVTGIMFDSSDTQAGGITVKREMPDMDFLVESNNRLWGCKYGVTEEGEMVNEIYASKLGDFKNWNCFMGLSTDSYAASCGSDGPFTGAITHMGCPLFWKENFLHKVYGNYPANFQIQTTSCRGVQKGCHDSLTIVNEVLYYKAKNAVCAFDGSLPVEVSYALGNESYSDAVAGSHNNKYYISMKDMADSWHLFVYDTAKNVWHREDDTKVDAFCSFKNELYAIVPYGGMNYSIVAMLGSTGDRMNDFEWMVQTGEIGISSPDMKYISRLTVRMSMDIGTEVNFYAQYDFSDEWELIFSLRSDNLRSFSVPIRPKRCDYMRLKIEGRGMAKIYSLTKTIEQGSEL